MAVLQKQVQEAKAAAAAAQTAAANAGGSDLDLKVKWKGAPELSSSDGKFKFKVRGRLRPTTTTSTRTSLITGRPDVSAVELRRARLGVEGVVWYDVKYKFEIDFADETVADQGRLRRLCRAQAEGLGDRRNQDRQPVHVQLARADHELALHHLHGAGRVHRGVLPRSSDRRRHPRRRRALVVPDRHLWRAPRGGARFPAETRPPIRHASLWRRSIARSTASTRSSISVSVTSSRRGTMT